MRISPEVRSRLGVSLCAWITSSIIAALAMTLGYDSRTVLPLLLAILPFLFLFFSGAVTVKGRILAKSANSTVKISEMQGKGFYSRTRELAVDLGRQYVGFFLALLIGIGATVWNNAQRDRFNAQIDLLRRNNTELTALTDDLFREIFKTAPRQEGAARVSLIGCRSIGDSVECAFRLNSTLPLNLYLERGTRMVDDAGNEYHATNSVHSFGYSEDGGIVMGPSGLILRGPLTFVLKFYPVNPEPEQIKLLETLASEGDGLVVFQFRNVDLQR